ncbi:AAA family ATPase [Mucilaginibacter litoreus]|uniref:AAA family ATPase n=1 Tax=Mucilaginibacter litoreus TaxID=1048221 RepID=A0ABW3ANE2_9SPHI
MIIKEITLQNFLCYFGRKKFVLSDGLNIILGENGEGKTKFFEALDWLFSGDDKGLSQLISAKALHDAAIGETFTVSVILTAEQFDNTKTIVRSFSVEKTEDGSPRTFAFQLEGIEENQSGERTPVDGSMLIKNLFPEEIRRYSLFKGETELNIFREDATLMNLVELYSDARHYNKYAEKGEFLREKAEKAVGDASRNDQRIMAKYTELEREIADLSADISNRTRVLQLALEDKANIEAGLQEVEKHVGNAEALETVNRQIRNLEERINSVGSKIQEDYTTCLFDEQWLLLHFEPLQVVFSEKIKQLDATKREQQRAYDREIGQRQGAAQLSAALIDPAIPLPLGTPSRTHMEEMIRDEKCKVCGRDAKKDSPEYKFMEMRLQEYLDSQKPAEEPIEEEVLFPNNYTHRLTNLSMMQQDNMVNIRTIRTKIKDHFEFNQARKIELDELNEQLAEAQRTRQNIIGSETGGAQKLTEVFKNYNGWQADLKEVNRKLNNIESIIESKNETLERRRAEKAALDTRSVHPFLLKTQELLRDIEHIFKETKEQKFDEFINLLQDTSNKFFAKLNTGAFTGFIQFNKIIRREETLLRIELQESGRTLYKPNQSLLTSMYISVLFAVAELTKTKRTEIYPLIFDAPTSSFGETKTGEFLNIIHGSGAQIILLSKDYITTDKETGQLSIKEEFNAIKKDRAFWIRLERPFDSQNLTTINTEVITY